MDTVSYFVVVAYVVDGSVVFEFVVADAFAAAAPEHHHVVVHVVDA